MKKDRGRKKDSLCFFERQELNFRYEEWKGMPEFIQEQQDPYKTIKVHFACQEDVDEFSKLLEQKINHGTRSIWFPKLQQADLLKKVCVDVNEE